MAGSFFSSPVQNERNQLPKPNDPIFGLSDRNQISNEEGLKAETDLPLHALVGLRFEQFFFCLFVCSATGTGER